jgi:hypothetical protein
LQPQDFTVYGRGYLGTVTPNFLGTKFEVYDFGLEPGYITKEIPSEFLPVKRRLCSIGYDTNFFAEKPRSFRVSVLNEGTADEPARWRDFENLAPKFNE